MTVAPRAARLWILAGALRWHGSQEGQGERSLPAVVGCLEHQGSQRLGRWWQQLLPVPVQISLQGCGEAPGLQPRYH